MGEDEDSGLARGEPGAVATAARCKHGISARANFIKSLADRLQASGPNAMLPPSVRVFIASVVLRKE